MCIRDSTRWAAEGRGRPRAPPAAGALHAGVLGDEAARHRAPASAQQELALAAPTARRALAGLARLDLTRVLE
eukprot:4719606-Alexandrium_andersonii.AAC.1